MAQYTFKSSGKSLQDAVSRQPTRSAVPFGIKTPLSLGDENGILAMNYSLADQLSDNLRNLLLTNWGERLGLYNFGANLRPLTTEYINQEDFDQNAIDRIRDAVTRWMPYIELLEFISDVDRIENRNTGIIKITVTYSIPFIKVENKAIQVVLYVI